MFFVLSTGRSGTQTMARALSQIPGCYCPHEPEPTLIAESSGYRHGQVSAEEVRRVLADTRLPLADGRVYGESNQTLSLLIPELVQVFPQAKFVWLVRNGLDVVASAVGRGWYPTEQGGWDRLGDRRRFWVSHRIRGDLCGDVPASQWVTMSSFERCCWYWSYVNRIISQDLSEHALHRFRQIRLEQIDSELAPAARWLGLPAMILPPSRAHNRVSGYRVYGWQDWTISEREQFAHWCGADMDRYYPSWRSDSGEWRGVAYSGPSTLQRLVAKHPRTVRALNRVYGGALRCIYRAWRAPRRETAA
jgi:hypothetical protein